MSIKLNGYAIQCRVTTEDPTNNFAPDTGKLTTYRSGGGFGIRLDAGNAFTGAEITPYYDSLLVKITAFDRTFEGAVRKAKRGMGEIRIRGVKTNMSFLNNILSHPTFVAGKCHTKFIEETPSLFDVKESKDRATKVLRYIGNTIVGQDEGFHKPILDNPRLPDPAALPPVTAPNLRALLQEGGSKALTGWVKDQKKLLITDTTFRDANQSLLATRVRTRDLTAIAEPTAHILQDAFSLEVWGGATFDTCYRFLHESPWERLDALRKAIPNIPFQMLVRGINGVGYHAYPENVIREFIREAARSGIDIFRIFDSFNNPESMRLAIETVKEAGKVAEVAFCYTDNLLAPKYEKYSLDYYLKLAKELEKMGADILCIKDMGGLLRPLAAKKLVTELKQVTDLPIHLHTHDTSGNQIAALMMAADAGVDIVDTAISSMSSLTSQPSMNSLVTALEGGDRDTGFKPRQLQKLSDYWEDTRKYYSGFEGDIKVPETEIYRYEIPGGQYTNLKPQVESLGLGHQFEEVKEKYSEVNDLLGGVIKVTPSSKMVGDFAIFMVQNKLDRENLLERGKELTFPRSVVDYFKGMMGQSTFPLPQELSQVVLKGEKPLDTLPSKLLPPADFDAIVKKLQKINPNAGLRQAIAYCLYPQVVEDFLAGYETYGDISQMPSDIFFYGMERGESMEMSIEEGKTLMIKYIGPGERNDDGTLELQFELNGSRRNVLIRDPHAEVEAEQIRLASAEDKTEIGATIMGAVSRMAVKPGDKVKKGDVVAIVEAMKMETGISAAIDGTVEAVYAQPGDVVQAGQLLGPAGRCGPGRTAAGAPEDLDPPVLDSIDQSRYTENRDIKRRTGFGLPVFCCFWGWCRFPPQNRSPPGQHTCRCTGAYAETRAERSRPGLSERRMDMKQTLILPINRAVVTASMGNAAYQARFGFPHYGTDLVSAVGDPTVYASGVGTLVAAGWDRYAGNTVIIRYPGAVYRPDGSAADVIFRYFHLAEDCPGSPPGKMPSPRIRSWGGPAVPAWAACTTGAPTSMWRRIPMCAIPAIRPPFCQTAACCSGAEQAPPPPPSGTAWITCTKSQPPPITRPIGLPVSPM